MNKLNFYQRARMSVFFYNSNPKALLRISGEDAEDYLQSQLSVDVGKLPVGAMRFALRLNTRGRVLAGGYLLKQGDEDFLLFSRGNEASEWVKRLDENVVADEVEFTDESSSWMAQVLGGTGIGNFLQSKGLTVPQEGQFTEMKEGILFLDERLPANTFTLLGKTGLACATDNGVREIGWEEIHKQRIEAGLFSVPEEIGPENLPQEGGLENGSVDFQKGCYLGQETMARIHATGKVRMQARAVTWDANQAPALPSPVLQGDKPVATLKSAVAANDGSFLGVLILRANLIPSLEAEEFALPGDPAQTIRAW